MNLFADIKSPTLLYLKGGLFGLIALFSAVLVVLFDNPWCEVGLLAVCVWSSCRFYYFFFYVLDHYVGGDKNASIFSMILKSAGRKDAPSPKKVLVRWIELFNKADASGLAELYHDDAVNHQVANEPVEGKENIRNMFEREFVAAEMVCIPENLFEDGEWAILEWKGQLGLRGCGFFHVVDRKIKFQRGYWDKLSFLRQHGLPIPME